MIITINKSMKRKQIKQSIWHKAHTSGFQLTRARKSQLILGLSNNKIK